METVVHARSLLLELPLGREYGPVLLKRGKPIHRVFVRPLSGEGLSLESLRLPPWTALTAYDALIAISLDDLPFATGTVELDGIKGIVIAQE